MIILYCVSCCAHNRLVSSREQISVIHALRVKGFATIGAIAVFTGLDHVTVDGLVAELAGVELVRFRGEPLNAWALSDAGRARHAELIADERAVLDASGGSAAVAALHGRFLKLNEPFKQLCTDWQLGGRTPERMVTLDRLHANVMLLIDPEATPLVGLGLDRLGLDRLGVYVTRFEHAVARVRDGDDAALTRPLTESYHDVWMELHEDLLTTLGLERSTIDGS